MAPEFRSSFIPKSSVTDDVFEKKKASPFGLFVLVIFVLSVLGSAGLFGYKVLLNKTIDSLRLDLSSKEASIDVNTIEKMALFSSQLKGAREVLGKHRIVSNFLNLLADSTVSSVQFSEFFYNFDSDGNLVVSLPGTARDYSSVALLERELKKSKFIRSANFGSLNLDESSGNVGFELSMVVDSKVSIYEVETLPTVGAEENNLDDLDGGDVLDEAGFDLPDIDDL